MKTICAKKQEVGARTNLDRVRDIVHQSILYVNSEINPVGWIQEMVMEGETYHQNRVAITLGGQMARVFKRVAGLTYEVCNFIPGYGVTMEEAEDLWRNPGRAQHLPRRKCKKEADNGDSGNDALIYTRYDFPKLKALVTEKVTQFLQEKKKPDQKHWRIDEEFICGLKNRAKQDIPKVDKVTQINIDLCLKKDDLIVIECKSTGDEDAPGAKDSLIDKIIIPIVIAEKSDSFRIPPSDEDRSIQSFFGITTNSRGYKKNGEWKGCLGGWLTADRILIEEKFWNIITPEGVSWTEFQAIVRPWFHDLKNRGICKSVYGGANDV